MRATCLFVLLASFALAGCDDPAQGKTAAQVEAPAPAPAAAPTPTVPDGAVSFDASAGSIAWTGSKVTGSHQGTFERFSGWMKRDPETNQVHVRVEIDMSSVTSDTPKLTGHLKSGDFFLVEKHPTAVFETTEPIVAQDGNATVTGNLTLRGVTKKITFPAEVTVSEGGGSLKSEFTIKRFDWGVAYTGMADDLIRDEVVIRLDFKP